MTNTEIEQRIRYLVEHGGVYDDPHEDIRRKVNTNRILAVVALVLVAVDVAIDIALLS